MMFWIIPKDCILIFHLLYSCMNPKLFPTQNSVEISTQALWIANSFLKYTYPKNKANRAPFGAIWTYKSAYKIFEERVHLFAHWFFTLKVYALSSDEDDDITVASVKSGKQSEKASAESDTESDKSDVLATRALIQKLSPAKPAKTVQSKVREMSSLTSVKRKWWEDRAILFSKPAQGRQLTPFVLMWPDILLSLILGRCDFQSIIKGNLECFCCFFEMCSAGLSLIILDNKYQAITNSRLGKSDWIRNICSKVVYIDQQLHDEIRHWLVNNN